MKTHIIMHGKRICSAFIYDESQKEHWEELKKLSDRFYRL